MHVWNENRTIKKDEVSILKNEEYHWQEYTSRKLKKEEYMLINAAATPDLKIGNIWLPIIRDAIRKLKQNSYIQ